MNGDPQKRKVLYEALTKDGYALGTLDEFSSKMDDPNKAKALYDGITKDGYEVGDFETFNAKVGSPKPAALSSMTTPLPGAAAGPSIGSGTQQAASQEPSPAQQPQLDAAGEQLANGNDLEPAPFEEADRQAYLRSLQGDPESVAPARVRNAMLDRRAASRAVGAESTVPSGTQGVFTRNASLPIGEPDERDQAIQADYAKSLGMRNELGGIRGTIERLDAGADSGLDRFAKFQFDAVNHQQRKLEGRADRVYALLDQGVPPEQLQDEITDIQNAETYLNERQKWLVQNLPKSETQKIIEQRQKEALANEKDRGVLGTLRAGEREVALGLGESLGQSAAGLARVAANLTGTSDGYSWDKRFSDFVDESMRKDEAYLPPSWLEPLSQVVDVKQADGTTKAKQKFNIMPNLLRGAGGMGGLVLGAGATGRVGSVLGKLTGEGLAAASPIAGGAIGEAVMGAGAQAGRTAGMFFPEFDGQVRRAVDAGVDEDLAERAAAPYALASAMIEEFNPQAYVKVPGLKSQLQKGFIDAIKEGVPANAKSLIGHITAKAGNEGLKEALETTAQKASELATNRVVNAISGSDMQEDIGARDFINEVAASFVLGGAFGAVHHSGDGKKMRQSTAEAIRFAAENPQAVEQMIATHVPPAEQDKFRDRLDRLAKTYKGNNLSDLPTRKGATVASAIDEKNTIKTDISKAPMDADMEAAKGDPRKRKVNDLTKAILEEMGMTREEAQAAKVAAGVEKAPEGTKAVTNPDGSVTLEKKPETGGAKAATATASAQPAKKQPTSKAVESVFSADEATGEEETPAAPTGVPEGVVPVSTEAAIGIVYEATNPQTWRTDAETDIDQAELDLDAIEARIARGKYKDGDFANTEFGRRLGTRNVMAVNEGLAKNPTATIAALRAAIENKKATNEDRLTPQAPAAAQAEDTGAAPGVPAPEQQAANTPERHVTRNKQYIVERGEDGRVTVKPSPDYKARPLPPMPDVDAPKALVRLWKDQKKKVDDAERQARRTALIEYEKEYGVDTGRGHKTPIQKWNEAVADVTTRMNRMSDQNKDARLYALQFLLNGGKINFAAAKKELGSNARTDLDKLKKNGILVDDPNEKSLQGVADALAESMAEQLGTDVGDAAELRTALIDALGHGSRSGVLKAMTDILDKMPKTKDVASSDPMSAMTPEDWDDVNAVEEARNASIEYVQKTGGDVDLANAWFDDQVGMNQRASFDYETPERQQQLIEIAEQALSQLPPDGTETEAGATDAAPREVDAGANARGVGEAQDAEEQRLAAEAKRARAERDRFVADWNERGQGLFAPEEGMAQQTIDGGFDNSQENFDAKVEPLNERVRQADKALADYVNSAASRAQAAAQQTSIPTGSAEAAARKAADILEKAKLKPDQLYALPLPPSVWNGAIRAMQEVIIAGGKAVDAIAAAIKHIQASDWWKNKATQKEKDEVTSHLKGKQDALEAAIAAEAKAEEPPPTPKAKSEPSGPKEVKKTFTTKRAYEGDFRDEVKAELAKSGLYRDIENQEEAEQRADDFIAKVGIEAALDAARAGDVRGGARSVIIVRALEALDRDYLAAKTQERIAEVVAKQTELIQWRSQILLEQGREASMMQRMYATSDLGFKSEAKAEEWRKEFGEEPSEEMMAKWKERDKEFAELKEKLAEAEKRAEKAEAAATMKALQDSVARQKSINRKTTPAQRSKVLADKIRTLKIGQRGVMSATIVPPQVWDGAVEAVAQAMEATGKLATAIQAGLQKIRESDWYKKIQKDEQQDSEASFTSAVNEAMGDDVESGPIRIPKQMIREAVANGAKDIDSLVATIKEQLKEAYPDATDRQIRDAITEYGKVVNLNKDELSAEVRRIKRIGRIVSALEDVASQKRPLRSGLQRDKLDAEERALNKELREAMKDLPVDAEAQARELRTALDAAKTRARNRIEDLQREIDTKQRAPKSERNRQADAELDALIDERDRLQAIHDDVFGEKPMTPGERKIASLQDQLDRIRQRDFPEAKESPQYTEEDLAKMKSLRDEIQEARAKAGLIASKELPKSPLEIEIDGKIKAKEKAILDLTERLSRGDLSPKPKTNGNTSYELEQLRAEHEKLVQELKDRRKAQEVKMTPQERSVKRLQDQLDDLLAGRLKDKERIMREKSQEEKDLVDAIAKQKALMGMTEPVRSAEENRLISIDRAIAETERRINELDLEAKKGSPIETAAIREKQQTLAERRNELNRLREEAGLNVKKPPTAEERLKQIIDATRRSVEALDQKIRDKNVDPAKPQSVPETPELKALRQRREKLREEYRKLQEEAGVITRRKLDTAKKAAKVRIQELERRIDQGDFSKKEAKPPVTDNELIRLQAKKMRLKEEYDKEFYKHKLLNRTMPERVKDSIWEAWGLTRALRASFDLSFVMMQGGLLTTSYAWHRPAAVGRAFKTMWQAMRSKQKSEDWSRWTKVQDWYPMLKEGKLAFTEPHAELSAREELFMSDWSTVIWNTIGKVAALPVRALGKKAYDSAVKKWATANLFNVIERGAAGYLTSLRIERALDGVEMVRMDKGREPTEKEVKDICDAVNTLTGRASIGKLEPLASTLAKIVFSTRLWASAIKTATPYAFHQFGLVPLPTKNAETGKWELVNSKGITPTARKMALQDLGRFIGTTMGIVALAATYLNNDDDDETGVETDPRSADFGKIKIGNKYIDPWGGRIQQLVFSTRMTIGLMSLIGEGMGEKPLPAYKDRKAGEVTPLGQGNTPTMMETALRMAQNKLAPSAGMVAEALMTKVRRDGTRTSFGQPYDMSDELVSNLYPIYGETVRDLAKEDPAALSGFLMFDAFFGGGVNVDEPKVETGRQQRQQPQQRPQPPRR